MLELYKNIKKRRLELGLTQSELASLMGYSDKSMISKIERGVVDLSQSKILEFAKVLRIDAGELMGNEGIDGLENISVPAGKGIPILGTICAGDGVECIEHYEGMFFIDNSVKADLCLTVKGDSMVDAGIYNGDKAFILRTYSVDNGKIYAVRLEGENQAVLKKVYMQGDNIVLSPCNALYEPIIAHSGNTCIIGECVGVYHAL